MARIGSAPLLQWVSKEQRNLPERTLRKLQIEPTAMEVPGRDIPTLSDLIHIFPKGAIIPIHELFLGVERFCRGQPVEENHGLDLPAVANAVPALVRNPWFGRTRSTSALAASAPEIPQPALAAAATGKRQRVGRACSQAFSPAATSRVRHCGSGSTRSSPKRHG